VDVDPTEKSKRAVIVTEIFDPPLPKESDNRGRHGVYIDDMRSLMLCHRSYRGKRSTLYNMLGLFSEYFEAVKATERVAGELKRRESIYDYNLWGERQNDHEGKREYCRLISRQQWEIAERALNSLQRDGLLTWKEYYRIVMPEILTMTDDGQQRLKAFKEL
jgi:hypothetical protein